MKLLYLFITLIFFLLGCRTINQADKTDVVILKSTWSYVDSVWSYDTTICKSYSQWHVPSSRPNDDIDSAECSIDGAIIKMNGVYKFDGEGAIYTKIAQYVRPDVKINSIRIFVQKIHERNVFDNEMILVVVRDR